MAVATTFKIPDLLQIAEAVAREKNIEREEVLEALEQAYQKAISLKPSMAEAHYSLGIFYEMHRKDMFRALIQYRKYLELGGKDERVARIVRQNR